MDVRSIVERSISWQKKKRNNVSGRLVEMTREEEHDTVSSLPG
jgi:hypothetical protein